MSVSAHISCKLFQKIDRTRADNPGVDCHVLSSEEIKTSEIAGHVLSLPGHFKAKVGQSIVFVHEQQFRALLNRNAELREYRGLPPEEAVKKVCEREFLLFPAWKYLKEKERVEDLSTLNIFLYAQEFVKQFNAFYQPPSCPSDDRYPILVLYRMFLEKRDDSPRTPQKIADLLLSLEPQVIEKLGIKQELIRKKIIDDFFRFLEKEQQGQISSAWNMLQPVCKEDSVEHNIFAILHQSEKQIAEFYPEEEKHPFIIFYDRFRLLIGRAPREELEKELYLLAEENVAVCKFFNLKDKRASDRIIKDALSFTPPKDVPFPFEQYRVWETVKKQDLDKMNTFDLMEEIVLSSRAAGKGKDDRALLFYELRDLVYSLDTQLSVEQKIRTVETALSRAMRTDSSLSKTFGLEHETILRKLAQDARAFFSRPEKILFSGITKDELETKFPTKLKELLELTHANRPGKVHIHRLLDITPPQALTCTRTKANEYTFALQNFPAPLSSEKKFAITQALSFKQDAFYLESIINGYENKWEGFVEEKPDGHLAQTHGIKGLKIYKDKAGRLVADIAVSYIGKGSFKRVKKIYRILPDGTICQYIRYTAIKDDPIKRDRFSSDISSELNLRQADKLRNVPNLLDIQAVGTYIGKKGEIKIRYEAELCDGSVFGLIFTSYESPIKDKDKTTKALACLRDGIRALATMHEKGYVHRDFKLDNLLYTGNKGLLSDLGLAKKIDDQFQNASTPIYAAPEVLLGTPSKNTPEQDMVSVGITLLFIIQPEAYTEIIRLQGGVLHAQGHDVLNQEEYLEQWAVLVKQLEDFSKDPKKDPRTQSLYALTSRLLNLDPKERPSSRNTLNALDSILRRGPTCSIL